MVYTDFKTGTFSVSENTGNVVINLSFIPTGFIFAPMGGFGSASSSWHYAMCGTEELFIRMYQGGGTVDDRLSSITHKTNMTDKKLSITLPEYDYFRSGVTYQYAAWREEEE